MHVFFQELNTHRKTVMIWILSLTVSLILMLLIFPAVMAEKEAYERIVGSLPPALLEAMSIDFENFMSFNGFLGYIYSYILLALCVLAMNLGLSALGKEVSGKTADFLMTRPIARTRLLTEKILAGVTLLFVTNMAITITIWIMNLWLNTEEKNIDVMLLIILSGWIIQLIFYALGIFIGILKKRIRFITSLSLSFVFAFYILAMVSQIVKKVYLYYLSPFRYFDYNSIIQAEGYELNYLLLSLALILMFTAASYITLENKEIHT